MTGGMAGIAGTGAVLYATVLNAVIPDVAAHLLVASVLVRPAAILISLIMVPETEFHERTDTLSDPARWRRTRWTRSPRGLRQASNCCSIFARCWSVLVALVHLANAILGLLPDVAGSAISLQRILGIVMAPVCWLMGIPWDQAVTAGGLMGIKTILNELIAYVDLSETSADALVAAHVSSCFKRDVWFRQFRFPWHHDRRPRNHGAGTSR